MFFSFLFYFYIIIWFMLFINLHILLNVLFYFQEYFIQKKKSQISVNKHIGQHMLSELYLFPGEKSINQSIKIKYRIMKKIN